jgi:hypothetical protein
MSPAVARPLPRSPVRSICLYAMIAKTMGTRGTMKAKTSAKIAMAFVGGSGGAGSCCGRC